MRVARWLLLALAAFLALAAAVVVLGLIVLQTSWAKDRLRDLAVNRANRVLNGQLSIGRLGGALLSGVALDDVRLVQDGVTVVEAPAVTVRYSLLTFVRQGLVLSEVVLRDPHVRVVETEQGWNVARLAKPSATPSGEPMAFAIRRLSVSGGAVEIVPRAMARRALMDVQLDATLGREAEGMAMHVGRLTGREETTGYVIQALSGEFLRSFADVRVRFELARAASRTAGDVELTTSDDGRSLAATVDTTSLDLATIFDTPRWTSDITGRATVRGVLASGAPPSLRFTFAGPHAKAFGYEATALDIAGGLDRGLLRFRGTAAAYGATVATDAKWQFANAESGSRAGLTATGTFRSAALTNLPPTLELPRFTTTLNGRYAVRTGTEGWSADVALEQSEFEGASLQPGTTGHVESAGGVVAYRAQGEIAGLDVQRLSAPLDIPLLAEDRFHGEVSGTFAVEGTQSGPGRRVISADASLADSTLGGAHFGAMALNVALDGQRLAVRAAGDFQGVTPTLAGLNSLPPFELNGTTDVAVTFHDLGAPIGVETLDVRGRVALQRSTARGVTVENGMIDADLVGGVATIRTLTLAAAGLHLDADGTAALGPTGNSDLRVVAAADDLSAVGKIVGIDLAGAADLNARVTGPADSPQAEGALNARSIAYGSTSALTLGTTFTATLPERNPDLLRANSKVEATFVKAGGLEIVRLGGTAGYDRRLVTLDTRIEQATRTVELAGVLSLQPEQREIALRHLQIDTAGAVWAMPAGRAARIDLGDDRVHVDSLVLARGDQRIEVGGDVGLGDQPPPDDAPPLTVRAERVQLADLNQILMSGRKLDGLLNATATIQGPIRTPDVAAEFLIVNGRIENMPFTAARGNVRYAESIATIDAELQQTSANRLTIAGTVGVPTAAATGATPGLDVRVQSTPIDLGFIQGFTTEVTDVTGTGTFDVHVTGQTHAPFVDGSIAIDQAGFMLDTTGVRYRNFDARLAFARNHLSIQRLQLTDDDGHTLSAEGGLDVIGAAAERSLDVRLKASDFHVLNNKSGSLQVDGTLQAAGGFLSPRITGDLRIAQGRLEVDQILETLTKNVYSTRPQAPEDADAPEASPGGIRAGAGAPGAAAPSSAALQDSSPSPPAPTPAAPSANQAAGADSAAAAAPGLFDRVDLAIAVTMPDNLVIRGRALRMDGSAIGLGDVNIVAGGSLDVAKRPGAPLAITGSLGVQRGYYAFQGRRFDVQRDSTVRFRGQQPIDPALDITATRVISGVETEVQVQGTMREPTIRLASRPPLDDAEVLSLIVFGQQINELGSSERTSLSERVASMAAGAIATPVADSVARALNLDLFEIQAPSGSSAPVVQLGSQIGERLYVGVRQEVGRGDRRRLSVEYRLSDVLRLVTSIAQGAPEQRADRRNEAGGVDLIYETRY
ncbi:MAG: translocation/assembly module TamB [Acidobacteria bacterium]|nr:translocation/assembly module TamB [Acidobacteriota bacterium]